MKRIRLYYLCAAGALALSMVSCGGDEKKPQGDVVSLSEAEEMFAESMTAADTAAVLEAGQKFMSAMMAGDTERALSMLVERDSTGHVSPLSLQSLESARRRFKMFPVKNFTLESYDFSIPSLNDLKYTVEIGPRDEKGIAPTMKLMFNPVKDGDKWLLMLKQPDQPSKESKNALDSRTPVKIK